MFYLYTLVSLTNIKLTHMLKLMAQLFKGLHYLSNTYSELLPCGHTIIMNRSQLPPAN